MAMLHSGPFYNGQCIYKLQIQQESYKARKRIVSCKSIACKNVLKRRLYFNLAFIIQDTLQYTNFSFIILDIFIHYSMSAHFPFGFTTQITAMIFVKHVAEKSRLSDFSLLNKTL
jgi:hypothetical protein